MASDLPVKFHPSSSFAFPKRSFGTGSEKRVRSFRAEWCTKFPWLHYDTSSDSAFCHVCLKAEYEKRLLASRKRDQAFISRGFTYWRDATACFAKHADSACHKEAVHSEILPRQTGDVAERLSAAHSAEKAENRRMLLLIMQSILFLARQGLPFRGSGSGENSNFYQLMLLRAKDCLGLEAWMKKKAGKYTCGDIQNELLLLMARTILRDLSRDLKKSIWYTIMADECSDASNAEQFVVCIRWVDYNLEDHEDVIGLYNVDNINSETLFRALEDVLLRLDLSMSQCRVDFSLGPAAREKFGARIAGAKIFFGPRPLLQFGFIDIETYQHQHQHRTLSTST